MVLTAGGTRTHYQHHRCPPYSPPVPTVLTTVLTTGARRTHHVLTTYSPRTHHVLTTYSPYSPPVPTVLTTGAHRTHHRCPPYSPPVPTVCRIRQVTIDGEHPVVSTVSTNDEPPVVSMVCSPPTGYHSGEYRGFTGGVKLSQLMMLLGRYISLWGWYVKDSISDYNQDQQRKAPHSIPSNLSLSFEEIEK